MERVLERNMQVRIGSTYAERMGYQHLVGAMGIIDDVKSALCGVIILGGPIGFTFIREDIHIEDCEVVEEEQRYELGVLINLDTGHAFYSENHELVQFARGCMHQASVREAYNLCSADEIYDYCDNMLQSVYYRNQERYKYFDWFVHDLNDKTDPESLKYLDTYEAHLATKEAEAATKHSVKTMADIVHQLRSELLFEGNSVYLPTTHMKIYYQDDSQDS